MMRQMKLATRAAAALALLGIATPALPCGEAKTSMAVKEAAPAASKEKVATQAPAPKAPSKAKSQVTPTATAAK